MRVYHHFHPHEKRTISNDLKIDVHYDALVGKLGHHDFFESKSQNLTLEKPDALQLYVKKGEKIVKFVTAHQPLLSQLSNGLIMPKRILDNRDGWSTCIIAQSQYLCAGQPSLMACAAGEVQS